jgi:NodT family efflux transporter outer membrane factor (OMF) lipoprotein
MNKIKKVRIQTGIIFVFVLFLTGCTAGPDFQQPSPPDTDHYISDFVPAKTNFSPTGSVDMQYVIETEKIYQEWWTELGSDKLNTLIHEALDKNYTLRSAESTLRQARELYAARSGATLYPQIDGNFSAQRQRFNPAVMGQSDGAREFSLFNAGVGVRYTFDLAGGNRRALEVLAAKSEYQRFELLGARLTLAANIIITAIDQGSLSEQMETVKKILMSQEEQLTLTRKRVQLGQAEPDDELVLQTQLEETRAALPYLRNQYQQTEHLLAVLTGRAPGASGQPAFSLEEFTLPADLPVLVPSSLVRARPDILAAEALMQTANAEYGVAVSRLYPQLNLSADLGSQALTVGSLFGNGSAVWSLMGQLTQPLFNPGLPAEKRAALAAFDAAAANYQVVVLESLRNVADTLSAIKNDSERLVALTAANAASEKLLNSAEHRYALGAAGYHDLLIAQQYSQQTQLDLIVAQAKRLINSVSLYQSMGGGFVVTGERLTLKSQRKEKRGINESNG